MRVQGVVAWPAQTPETWIRAGEITPNSFGAEYRSYGIPELEQVTLTLPEAVRAALEGGKLEPYGSEPEMRPDVWARNLGPPEAPQLRCLAGAWVFGGSIIDRTRAQHWDGQLTLTASGRVFPGSYGVMDGFRTLSTLLASTGSSDGGWSLEIDAQPRRLSGTYLLLGSVHRHFGHVLLEGLTRAWALPYLCKELAKDVRFIVYEPSLRPFAEQLLALAGIPAERIVHASPIDCVEQLVVPDVAMRTHRWITPLQRQAWNVIAAAVEAPAPDRRIFLSRSAVNNRPLSTVEDVEAVFAAAGWEVIRPETLSMAEQVRLARSARSLAGEVGSQMYLAAFQPSGGRNLVIAPRNFFLADDVLLSSALGHDLAVVLGSPLDFSMPKPERTWSVDIDAVAKALAPLG